MKKNKAKKQVMHVVVLGLIIAGSFGFITSQLLASPSSVVESDQTAQIAAPVQLKTETKISAKDKSLMVLTRKYSVGNPSTADITAHFSITLTAPSYKDIKYILGPSLFTPAFVVSAGANHDNTATLQPVFTSSLFGAFKYKTVDYRINNYQYTDDDITKQTLKKGTSKTFDVQIAMNIPVPISTDNTTISAQDFNLQMKLVSVNIIDGTKKITLPITDTNLATPSYNFLAAGNYRQLLFTQAGRPVITSATYGSYPATANSTRQGVEVIGTVPVLVYNDQETPFTYTGENMFTKYVGDDGKTFSYFPAPEDVFTRQHSLVGSSQVVIPAHSYKVLSLAFKDHYFNGDDTTVNQFQLTSGTHFALCMNASTDDLRDSYNGQSLDCFSSDGLRTLYGAYTSLSNAAVVK